MLTVLQLTRMALVFTAISNSLCEVVLLAAAPGIGGGHWLAPGRVIAVLCISVGLYGFGMSLNDIIDRRRDSQLASHRPLPSGRIGVGAAHIVSAMLLLLAVAGGLYYAHGWTGGPGLVAE